jgi:hypothetical protein
MQVGISQSIQKLDYDLDVRAKVVHFPAQTLALSLLQSIQTGSKTHAVSYSIDTGRSLARGSEAGAHSSPFTWPSFQIRKQHICISTFPYEFMVCKMLALLLRPRNFKRCCLIGYFILFDNTTSTESVL